MKRPMCNITACSIVTAAQANLAVRLRIDVLPMEGDMK